VDKLVQQDAPELERRLTELQSQVNRLSLSLHLWQERQDRLLEQRLTDWSAVEARAQKDASTRMRELQATIEHEWNELRQGQVDPGQYLRELGTRRRKTPVAAARGPVVAARRCSPTAQSVA
jgi:TolA-binding protein